MLALSDAYDTVFSKNVAHLLDIKRPTVHHALEVLQEKGLIRKELYGDVRLTDADVDLIRACWADYEKARGGTAR